MTQRSIQAGSAPAVVVRSGGDVAISGWDSEQVMVQTDDRRGLKVERRGDQIEIQVGGNGSVKVPTGSDLKVYAGKSAEVRSILGQVTVYAGLDARIGSVRVLEHVSAGGVVDLDCETVAGEAVKFSAGRDLRCRIRRLSDVSYRVDDLGGNWQAFAGSGRTLVELKAGGDVTLVTDQELTSQSPNGLLGAVLRPDD
jgi:hypothetical protein